MEWLNYHHLRYFWVVARTGSIVAAAKELHLSHPTISAQIRELEGALGQRLFERKGRSLVLTEAGRRAFRYADEIFVLGRDLVRDVRGGAPSDAPVRLVVGVSDALAKSVVHRILEPAFGLSERVHVVCRESRPLEAFMADLAAFELDVVLSDTPAPSGSPVRAYSHPLGECGSVFFAAPELARSCRWRFPASLDGVPFLLPATDSTFRRALGQFFDASGVRPQVVAELDDAALTNVLGEAGLGVFAAPEVIEREVRRRYKVHVVGRGPTVRQRFYAISIERKIRHPAVAAICEVARKHIFA